MTNINQKKYLDYNSMNNNLTFSYNNKVYKTEAAMKKATTMDTKRAIKQAKEKLMQFLRKLSKDNKLIFQNNY